MIFNLTSQEAVRCADVSVRIIFQLHMFRATIRSVGDVYCNIFVGTKLLSVGRRRLSLEVVTSSFLKRPTSPSSAGRAYVFE